MVETLCNLTHCKASYESNHMKHVVSYGKSHKTLKQVTHLSYIVKIVSLLLSYTGDTESNLSLLTTNTTTEVPNRPTTNTQLSSSTSHQLPQNWIKLS